MRRKRKRNLSRERGWGKERKEKGIVPVEENGKKNVVSGISTRSY